MNFHKTWYEEMNGLFDRLFHTLYQSQRDSTEDMKILQFTFHLEFSCLHLCFQQGNMCTFLKPKETEYDSPHYAPSRSEGGSQTLWMKMHKHKKKIARSVITSCGRTLTLLWLGSEFSLFLLSCLALPAIQLLAWFTKATKKQSWAFIFQFIPNKIVAM